MEQMGEGQVRADVVVGQCLWYEVVRGGTRWGRVEGVRR